MTAQRFTEAELLEALRDRYTVPGNGGAGRYAFLTHVRTGAAFDQQEIDAVVFCLWPSDGHDLHAFEVKCSRSDWLREIQYRGALGEVRPSTSKSRRTREIADTFTVVAPAGVVRAWEHTAEGRTGKPPTELPEGWGLIEARRSDAGVARLRQVVKPARLQLPRAAHEKTIDRGFVVAMLRRAGAVPGRRATRPVGGVLEALEG